MTGAMNRSEVETRVVLKNVNDTLFEKVFGRHGVVCATVQSFRDVVVYDSCRYRIKTKRKCKAEVHFGTIVPVFYSFESALKSVVNMTHECRDIQNQLLIAKELINPVTRYSVDDVCGVDVRAYVSDSGVMDVVIELEMDRSEIDFPAVVRQYVRLLDPQDVCVPFPKRTNIRERVRPLRFYREIANSTFVASPKWNGVRRKMMVTESEVHFVGTGTTPTIIMSKKKELETLRNMHMHLYFLLRDCGLQVEELPIGKFVLIDLYLRDDLISRISLIRKLNASDVLSRVLKLDIVDQTFVDVDSILQAQQIFSDRVHCDGLILNTRDMIWKLKPQKFQTVDLLLNVDGILVTREGIAIGSKVSFKNVLKKIGVVYECKITWPSVHDELSFRGGSKLTKKNRLESCTVQCLKIREDKGVNANTFDTVCKYLESDLLNVLLQEIHSRNF